MNKNGKPTPEELLHYQIGQFKEALYKQMEPCVLSISKIVNKETPFYHKKVVITGIIDAYPMREELAQLLKQYGADINSSISGKTNIVIVGHGAGPSKMKKIEDLNSNGAGIRIIYEPEFLEIIEKYNIE